MGLGLSTYWMVSSLALAQYAEATSILEGKRRVETDLSGSERKGLDSPSLEWWHRKAPHSCWLNLEVFLTVPPTIHFCICWSTICVPYIWTPTVLTVFSLDWEHWFINLPIEKIASLPSFQNIVVKGHHITSCLLERKVFKPALYHWKIQEICLNFIHWLLWNPYRYTFLN